MLELLTAVVCLVVGLFVGMWIRRNAIADFERGVSLGLAQLGTLVKTQANVQHPRHDQPRPQHNGPQEKK